MVSGWNLNVGKDFSLTEGTKKEERGQYRAADDTTDYLMTFLPQKAAAGSSSICISGM